MKPTFVRSPENLAIVDTIEASIITAPEGEVVSYAVLRNKTGINQMNANQPLLKAALKRLSRQGIVTKNVKGIGYFKPRDGMKVAEGGVFLKSVRNKARKGNHYVSCADDANLDKVQRCQKMALQTVLSNIEHNTRGATVRQEVKKVESVFEQTRKALAETYKIGTPQETEKV